MGSGQVRTHLHLHLLHLSLKTTLSPFSCNVSSFRFLYLHAGTSSIGTWNRSNQMQALKTLISSANSTHLVAATAGIARFSYKVQQQT